MQRTNKNDNRDESLKVPQLPAEAQADVEWDPEDPESILGARVAVQWAGNRFYDGYVDEYDATTGQHHVLYDDNDKRW